jgi:hypothetical protein
MSTHHVVKTGIAWPFSSTPNCKKMIGQLERNEALVTWLVPNNGDIKDQIPAIRVKDNFYTMSLRMMKAVWRFGTMHTQSSYYSLFISITQISGTFV